MRIALLTAGSRGDVQPMVALATELCRRGHRVTLLTNENFVEWLGESPFEVVPLPIDSEELLRSAEGQALLANGRLQEVFKGANRKEEERSDAIVDAFALAVEGADVIVSMPLTAFRGLVMAEKLGVAQVLVFLQPAIPTREFPHWALPLSNLGFGVLNLWSYDFVFTRLWRAMSPALDAMRVRLAMPPSKGPPSPLQYASSLSLFSEELVPRPRDWDSGHQVTGFAAFESVDRERVGEVRLPGELEAWLAKGDAPIFFGFGSMPVLEPRKLLRDIERLCRHLGTRALIGSGWSDYGASSGDSVFIVGAVDHEQLLPRCRAAVHHGGAGTTHTALRAGLPSLVCSVCLDQPFWGRSVKRLGVGDSIPFKKLNFATMKRLLPPLLDAGTKARAAQLGARLRNENGAKRAADLIEAKFWVR